MPTFDFTFTLRDAYTRESARSGQIDAADFATALTAVVAYLDDYQTITEAEIIKYKVSQEAAYAGTLTAGANIDEGATFSFEKADGDKAAYKVPSPKNGILTGQGQVDLAHADVVAWAAHIVGGPVLISDGETATSLLKGTLDR